MFSGWVSLKTVPNDEETGGHPSKPGLQVSHCLCKSKPQSKLLLKMQTTHTLTYSEHLAHLHHWLCVYDETRVPCHLMVFCPASLGPDPTHDCYQPSLYVVDLFSLVRYTVPKPILSMVIVNQ